MTKRAKRICKKIMGEGISRNAARLIIDEIKLAEGIKSVHNNGPKKLAARFAALKLDEMDFVNDTMDKYFEFGSTETGEDDG